MDNIETYNMSMFLFNSMLPKKAISWITILIIVFIIFIIFANIPYAKYKNYIGYIDCIDNNYYIKINLEESDFPFINNNYLYIMGKKQKYKIVSISNNIVTIKTKLDKNYLISNNKVLLSILNNKISLLELFIKKVKKGLNL